MTTAPVSKEKLKLHINRFTNTSVYAQLPSLFAGLMSAGESEQAFPCVELNSDKAGEVESSKQGHQQARVLNQTRDRPWCQLLTGGGGNLTMRRGWRKACLLWQVSGSLWTLVYSPTHPNGEINKATNWRCVWVTCSKTGWNSDVMINILTVTMLNTICSLIHRYTTAHLFVQHPKAFWDTLVWCWLSWLYFFLHL